MSLRSLLPIGRSFSPHVSGPGRYRPADPGVVPDFSDTSPRVSREAAGRDSTPSAPAEMPARTPMPTPTRTLSEPAGQAAAFPSAFSSDPAATRDSQSPSAPVPAEPTAASPSTTAPGLTRPASADGRSLATPWTRRTGTAAASRRRLPLWIEQLLLTLFGPGNRRRNPGSEQTEMDFRAVKVARNDLTTADVEMIPIRAPRAETSLSPDCRKRVLRLWFDQGSSKLRRWSASLF